jgi:phosphatidylglycerol lysyltransferase
MGRRAAAPTKQNACRLSNATAFRRASLASDGVMGPSAERDRRDRLLAIRAFGRESMSFLGLESDMQCWEWSEGSPTPVWMVACVDTGSAWVAAGSPLAEPSRVAEVATAFVDDARTQRRQACFFGCEGQAFPGFARLLLGEQPVWTAASWRETLATHRRLREQIRRAAAKGVTVRMASAADLSPGTSLRSQVDALALEWLESRRMAPMGFLVALEPFHAPEEHRYLVAERKGRLVAFASAVPIYRRGGWLVEDVVRDASAPNGTTEALLDRLMRDVAEDESVTLGLTPLSGPVSRWLRVVRFASRPMFDFAGLRAFRQRLRPMRWESVWLF